MSELHALYQLGRVRGGFDSVFAGAYLWFEVVPDRGPSEQPEALLTSIEVEDRVCIQIAAEAVELMAAFATDEEVIVMCRSEQELERYLAAARAGETLGDRQVGEELRWEVNGVVDVPPEPAPGLLH